MYTALTLCHAASRSDYDLFSFFFDTILLLQFIMSFECMCLKHVHVLSVITSHFASACISFLSLRCILGHAISSDLSFDPTAYLGTCQRWSAA